jgi:hypothetical protein
MIPHRAKLALAAAACCALASCLDARVNVPVWVAPIDKEQNVRFLPGTELKVYKANEPSDETHPQRPQCAGTPVAEVRSALDGKTSFNLLPGHYEICSEVKSFGGESFYWKVPFEVVEDGGLRVPRWVGGKDSYTDSQYSEHDQPQLVWQYPEGGGKTDVLLLSRDNAFKPTPPTPTPAPTESPAASPSPSTSPGAQTSPTAQASPTASPTTTVSPSPTATPATTATPAITPTPNPQPAAPRVPSRSRRRRRV